MEKDVHKQTKSLLDKEKTITLDLKKQIIELRSELDHLVEVVRRDMSNRITSKNVSEELYSLSSNLVKSDVDGTGAATPSHDVKHSVDPDHHDDIFLQQHDWKKYISQIKVNMTQQEVNEAHATLHNLNKSFEILSSRLVLECRHRAECEFKLTGAKENLREIKDDIISEATLRLQLEEEMQYFKEMTEKQKEEIEKHKKFSVIAKKAAYDAIKQAKYYQRKLKIEIDNISETGLESKSLNQATHDHNSSSRKNSPLKSNRTSSKVINLDEFDGLFDDEDEDEESRGSGRQRRNGGKRSVRAVKSSPYLNGSSKSLINPYYNLQTRSENEKDFQANGSVSSKKSKKIKIPGKKQMSYVGKKISRVLFDGKQGSRSSVGIAPHDDSSSSIKSGGKSPHKGWVNPNYINYAEKYGKPTPNKSASRRQYTSQHPRE